MLLKDVNGFKFLKYVSLILVFFISCGGGDDSDSPDIPSEPENIIPANLTLSISVVGVDSDNPNGNGSGIIKCEASASKAVNYSFRFGGGVEVESTIGKAEHTFTKEGANDYTVYVYAYSSTGDYIIVSEEVIVYVTPNDNDGLLWSDEFDTDGAPDSSKWNYDIGTGDWGWGNGESQYYTDRPDNAIVEDGVLKIIAKKENFSGSNYTSARLKTQGKFSFTYGKVEVRAKLPQGGGTWPAIWMLGSNITDVGWPACGEIDIMEHWGHNPTHVSSATHNTNCSGGCPDVSVGNTTIVDYATEFHVYAIEWSEEEIDFLIDGEFKYRYRPSVKNDENWPYTKDQFIILNVAMGGSWFTIDPNFVQSAMEIDYVRVYQE